MRIRIAHRNVYRYESPATGVIQVLRLTPRNHEGQYVMRWRIDVSVDTRLAAHEDAFGNITHVFSADGPLDELSVEVDGEVETQNTEGIVRGTVERFAPSLFLRDTALTQADAAMREFTRRIRAEQGGAILAELHWLLDRLFEQMGHDADDMPDTLNAADAFARKYGSARDLSQVFIGAGGRDGRAASHAKTRRRCGESRGVSGIYRPLTVTTGTAPACSATPQLG